jgi:hypothetical protein
MEPYWIAGLVVVGIACVVVLARLLWKGPMTVIATQKVEKEDEPTAVILRRPVRGDLGDTVPAMLTRHFDGSRVT